MWTEHNQIRDRNKELHNLMENHTSVEFQDFQKQLGEIAGVLRSFLSDHFFKENNILFPSALRVITNDEWEEIRKEFDEIGYCCFTPLRLTVPRETKEVKKEETEESVKAEKMLQFETGSLSEEEVEAVLDSLPVDISFVDKEDQVKYFNKAEGRIFVRTKAVIGRKVQQCHPQKSVHVVSSILEAFKAGKKDVAEFWIQMNDRLIHIRYLAVRDKSGNYLGTLEVTQDITNIKKIEGEKRLLDWKA